MVGYPTFLCHARSDAQVGGDGFVVGDESAGPEEEEEESGGPAVPAPKGCRDACEVLQLLGPQALVRMVAEVSHARGEGGVCAAAAGATGPS